MNSLDQLSFLPFPELTTPRLRLRQMQVSDSAEVFFLRSDDRVLQFLDKEKCTSEDEAREWIEMVNGNLAPGDGLTWALCTHEDPTMFGSIAFWRMEKHNFRSEIGYTMHPAQWGKGFMLEAMGAALHYGFEQIGLHSVEANVNPSNMASIKLLERCGFVREAYYRENWYFNGKFLDSAVYSLLNPHSQRA